MTPAATDDDLLSGAEAVLGGSSANRNRIACWFARTALERVVDRLLVGQGVDAGEATMRSRLSCLQVVLDDPALIASAEYTWARLSNACHHHAFQLEPSLVETRHLLENVRILLHAAEGRQLTQGGEPSLPPG